jgi:hypothetical protein
MAHGRARRYRGPIRVIRSILRRVLDEDAARAQRRIREQLARGEKGLDPDRFGGYSHSRERTCCFVEDDMSYGTGSRASQSFAYGLFTALLLAACGSSDVPVGDQDQLHASDGGVGGGGGTSSTAGGPTGSGGQAAGSGGSSGSSATGSGGSSSGGSSNAGGSSNTTGGSGGATISIVDSGRDGASGGGSDEAGVPSCCTSSPMMCASVPKGIVGGRHWGCGPGGSGVDFGQFAPAGCESYATPQPTFCCPADFVPRCP